MTKKTKKRNKTYSGVDAVPAQPVVHRYTAVKRSRAGEWWLEKKKPFKIVSVILIVLILLAVLVSELMSLARGQI